MSDIYSLGVIILKILINKKDFDGRRFDDYLDTIRLDYPVLSSLLDDILDKNPDIRLLDMQRNIKSEYDIPEEKSFSNLRDISDEESKELNQQFSDLYDTQKR